MEPCVKCPGKPLGASAAGRARGAGREPPSPATLQQAPKGGCTGRGCRAPRRRTGQGCCGPRRPPRPSPGPRVAQPGEKVARSPSLGRQQPCPESRGGRVSPERRAPPACDASERRAPRRPPAERGKVPRARAAGVPPSLPAAPRGREASVRSPGPPPDPCGGSSLLPPGEPRYLSR